MNDDSFKSINEASIVLLGTFNPAIFHPSWYQAQKLIRPEEEADAKVGLTHPEISQFSTDWFKMRVTRDSFTVSTTNEAQYNPLRDLVQGTFEILCHTPMKQMGLNRNFRFQINSKSDFESLLDRLAPKSVLNSIVTISELKLLTLQGERENSQSKGYVQVQIYPSKNASNEISVLVNDHFEIEDEKQGAQKLIDILKNQWKESEKRARKIFNNVLGVVKNGN